jgi:secretion/DNA translocation related TadE-like protein
MSDDRGVATVWAAGAIAVLVSMAVFGMRLGEAMVVRHHVEAAADLAALAGAATVVAGEQYSCTQARRITDRMRVQLASCRVQGWTVLVETTVRPAGWLASLGAPTAQARAGPAAASRRELDSTDVLLDKKVRAVEFTPRDGVQCG